MLNSGADNKVTLSMMLRYSGSHSGTSQAFLGLASGANMNGGSNSPGDTSQVGAAVKTGMNLTTRGGTNGGVGNSGDLSSNTTLITGNWYLYHVGITKPSTGSNVWAVDSFLQDYGATGLSAGATVLSYSGATNAFNTAADAGINAPRSGTFLHFGVRGQMWIAADKLRATTVPEPAAPGMMLLGIPGLAGRRRSR